MIVFLRAKDPYQSALHQTYANAENRRNNGFLHLNKCDKKSVKSQGINTIKDFHMYWILWYIQIQTNYMTCHLHLIVWFQAISLDRRRNNTLTLQVYGTRICLQISYHLTVSYHSLPWRHDRREGVSNYQRHRCLLNRLFRQRSKKTSKFRVTGLCVGNSPVTGTKASDAELWCFLWWRHHVDLHLGKA